MPIGEAHKSGSSFTGLAEYILAQGIYKYQNNEKKPEIIFRNHVYSSNYLELGSEFRDLAKENSRVTKPVMHLTVNFKNSDNISNDNQKKFVQKIIYEMGVRQDNHQFLVVKHNDKHPHYHIEINRVGFDGITLSDSNSKLRIGTACDKVEKEMGLDNYLHKTRAFVYDEKTKTYVKNPNRSKGQEVAIIKTTRNRQVGIQEKKDFIQIQTLKALDNIKVNSLDLLEEELKKRNITFQYSINKKDQVAVSFQYKGLAVKGSKISLKGSLIKKQLLANQKTNHQLKEKKEHVNILKEIYPNLVKSVEQIVQEYNSGKIPNINSLFKKNGIIFNSKGDIEYKSLTLSAVMIKQFEKDFNLKLKRAQKVYETKFKEYQNLQKMEVKKSFLGILNSKQKQFNKELKNKKDQTKEPSLEVGIKINNFIKLIDEGFKNTYEKVSAEKVVRYVMYSLDGHIKLKMAENLKLEKKNALAIEKKEQHKNTSIIRSKSKKDDLEPSTRKGLSR
ncbi:hypothetical protein FHR24_000871 [Wenyingzhuangia heitensis]|uniref:MobA/VirD2-like nuclease domain-containing protein n=1 Tax=Wenyingzhuangia heitensis TaxID=1487859 RepID=A0ABX0UBI6_9FLAO|nr:hypothetical protein [Wenyingzhuangia heitensis]NIJ44432.1 hypothetical protein [Wenyingzhuangia heitensis]